MGGWDSHLQADSDEHMRICRKSYWEFHVVAGLLQAQLSDGGGGGLMVLESYFIPRGVLELEN